MLSVDSGFPLAPEVKIQIVALTGPIGSGKTLVADILQNHHGFMRIRFARILKDMLAVLGLGYEELEGNAKEKPSELLCGRTPRWAMQSLGTEWGRDLIHPDLWIAAWKRRVMESATYAAIRGEKLRAVVEDLRFPNEEAAIREFKESQIWQIKRPGLTVIQHVSELQQIKADAVIENNSDVRHLELSVATLLR